MTLERSFQAKLIKRVSCLGTTFIYSVQFYSKRPSFWGRLQTLRQTTIMWVLLSSFFALHGLLQLLQTSIHTCFSNFVSMYTRKTHIIITFVAQPSAISRDTWSVRYIQKPSWPRKTSTQHTRKRGHMDTLREPSAPKNQKTTWAPSTYKKVCLKHLQNLGAVFPPSCTKGLGQAKQKHCTRHGNTEQSEKTTHTQIRNEWQACTQNANIMQSALRQKSTSM